MVHEKYIKVGGKTYGPYYYESYRENGKVKKRYVKAPSGASIGDKKGFNFFENRRVKDGVSVAMFFVLIGLGIFALGIYGAGITGHAVFDSELRYAEGELISGNLGLVLRAGELIPADSIVRVSLGEQVAEIAVRDLVSSDLNEGDFYAEGVLLEDSGEGYGVVGVRERYPDVEFELFIESSNVGDVIVGKGDVGVGGSGDGASGGSDGRGEGSKGSGENDNVDEGEEIVEVNDENVEEGVEGSNGDEEVVEESGEEDSEGTGESAEGEEISGNEGIPGGNSGEENSEAGNDGDNSDDEEDTSSGDGENSGESNDGDNENGAEESASSGEGVGAGITGGAIGVSGREGRIVSGIVSAENEFVYSLVDGENAEIVEGSVESEGEKLSQRVLELDFADGGVRVSTDYVVSEEGFGEEFLSDESERFEIDVSKFGIVAEEGELKVELIFGESEIATYGERIEFSEEKNESEFVLPNITDSNITIVPNETIIPESNISVNESEIVVRTSRDLIEINKKVRWEKNVEIRGDIGDEKVVIELPEIAENVSVDGSFVEGNVVLDGKQRGYEIEYLTEEPVVREEKLSRGKLVVVSGPEEVEYDDVLAYTEIKSLGEGNGAERVRVLWRNYDVYEVGKKNPVELGRKEVGVSRVIFGKSEGEKGKNVEEVTSGNITEGVNENEVIEQTSRGAGITGAATFDGEVGVIDGALESVGGRDDLEVGNLGAEFVGGEVVIKKGKKIERERREIYVLEEVPFEFFDSDGDNVSDSVRWVVPHLSEQEFEIILVSQAEHLDVNRSFISDITEEVIELDGNWSEEIAADEYVRVIFERNLTQGRDITIYPRTFSGEPRVEVYEINSEIKIAEFTTINDEVYNTIYLTEWNGSQDAFDLRVKDGSLEFDHIIDPLDGAPDIEFVGVTPVSGQNVSDFIINISSNDASDHYVFTELNRDVVLWMRFDDLNATGSPTDLSSWSNNGTIVGAGNNLTATGYFGNGFEVANGGNGYVTLGEQHENGYALRAGDGFTVSFWVNPNLGNGDMFVISNGDDNWPGTARKNFAVNIDNDGDVALGMGNDVGSCTVNDFSGLIRLDGTGIWNHVVAEVNLSGTPNVTMYIDGESVYNELCGEIDPLTPVRENVTLIGTGRTNGQGQFNGTVDEVIIFNRSLSGGEISALYNSSSTEYYNNFTGDIDEGDYTFTGYAVDSAGNLNNTKTRDIIYDVSGPSVTIDYPDNSTPHYISDINFNATVIDSYSALGGCFYSLDGAANVSMSAVNASFFSALYSGISHGLHNVSVSCNDTAGNWGSATEENFDVVLLDLSVPSVSYPSPTYPNLTDVVVNVSNSAPPSASNINVSCRIDGVIFDSYVISSLGGASSNISACQYGFLSGNYSVNVTVDPDNEHPESDETNNWNVTTANAVIILRNESSEGFVSGTSFVNDNENVNLTIEIPENTINSTRVGYNLSRVWVQIERPDEAVVNVSLSSIDGSFDGGIWNASYDHGDVLGDYLLTYYANLSNGFSLVETRTANFSVQNLSISINVQSDANTTQNIDVTGLIQRFNGTDFYDLDNNVFLIKLNGEFVSTDSFDDGDFSSYAGENVNLSSNVQLNLTQFGAQENYSDDYSTTKYTTDAYNYNSIGYSTAGTGDGRIFELDQMTSGIGNVTYRYVSVTAFRNATVVVNTASSPTDNQGSGNTSVWYSFDNSTWIVINSSTSVGASMVSAIPVDLNDELYVMLQSDTNDFSNENPVTFYGINYTEYLYAESGIVNSSAIFLPNVSYTEIAWDEDLNGFGDVVIQLRESEDGASWGDWSSNFSDSSGEPITEFSEDYLQYRAFLNTTNTSVSPILYAVNISYFNATTNSTGGYDETITIPTTTLGPQTLEVNVSESPEGIIERNTTSITIWAVTNVSHAVSRNYTQANANYSVNVNLTRIDLGSLINGTISVNVSNGTYSDTQTCVGRGDCNFSWFVPSDLVHGNYSVNISAHNESGYFINSSFGYEDFLEARNTTGSLSVENVTLSGFTAGNDYNFLLNTSISNTGGASMYSLYVFDGVSVRSPGITDIQFVSGCSRVYPSETCNVTMNISVDGSAAVGEANAHFISWRANWSDNDGSVAGGASLGYIQYTQAYVIIPSNSTFSLSNSSVNLTIEHGTNKTFVLNISSIGTTPVNEIEIEFISETLNETYVDFTPSSVSEIAAGSGSSTLVNVTIPLQHAPGNYSGIINVSANNANSRTLNLTVEIPRNSSWSFVPSANLTYNVSFGLDTPGEIGNITILNLGNINQTFAIDYSPWGTPYTDLEEGLIEEDDSSSVSGLIVNPTLLNVTKGENNTLTVYQKGYSDPLSNVGVALIISNTTGVPTSVATSMVFSLAELIPNIEDIEFILDGVTGTIAEVNKNVTVKVVATDDIDLNESYDARVNITTPSGGLVQINATDNGEKVVVSQAEIAVNFTGNYTPTSAGTYNVTALVRDDSGNFNSSGVFEFVAYGTTNFSFAQNFSSLSTNDIDLNTQKIFYVNYTINNTGLVYGYDANISFIKNDTIVVNTADIGNVSSGTNTSRVVQFNVSSLTAPGDYNITTNFSFRNPDNTREYRGLTFELSIGENKSLEFSQNVLNVSVLSGNSNSSVLEINNTGNVQLTNVSLNCISGTLCGNFTVSFNHTGFNISTNSSVNVNVSLTAPSGLNAGYYEGVVNVTEQNISKTFNLVSTVPESLTWSVTPTSIDDAKAAGQSGVLEIVNVTNTGNVDLELVLNSTNSSIATPNVSSLSVLIGEVTPFAINYSAPEEDGAYNVNITITNSSATPPQINVTVNLNSTNLNITVLSPTGASPLTGVNASDTIQILTNATFEGVLVNDNSTWSATVGGSECAEVSSSFDSSNVQWGINCSAPDVADGESHDLVVTLDHEQHGSASVTESDAIVYTDITVPVFNEIERNNVPINTNISLVANVTDNVNVSAVIVSITYPNGTIVNGTMRLDGGLYNYTDLNLTLAGEYLVNYTANDTTNNVNSTTDWFEVLDRYNYTFNFVSPEGTSVSGVNITLLRPNTTTVLLNNATSSGGGDFLVNKRFYDIKSVLSEDSVVVRNVNFTDGSNFYLNLHRMEVDDLSDTVPLHKIFDGISSNSTNLSVNVVNARFNYSGLNYDEVGELGIVKCENWNFSLKSCAGTWSALSSSIDRDAKIVEGNSTGFSSYFLAENKCGNGLCEGTYAETESTCSQDCVTAQGSSTSSGGSSGGGGGGGGGLSSTDISKIEEIIKSFINIGGVKIETTSIYKELFAGDTTTFRVKLINTLNSVNTIELRAEGEIASFIFFDSNAVELEASETRDSLVQVIVPQFTEPGNYDGELVLVSGEEEGNVPVTIRVLSPEGKLLDVKIEPLQRRVEPGGVLRLQTDLLNLGKTDRVDIQFDLQLIDIETGEVFARSEEAFAVETSVSSIKEFNIPETVPTGDYLVKAVAYYSSLEDAQQQATSISSVEVNYVFWKRKLFNVSMWIYLIGFGFILSGVGGFYLMKYLEFRGRRFKSKVEFNKLPSPGPHSAFVGKIAETGVRAFIDMNKLQMHTLIAGSTGSGKTVAAQDIIEAALLHNKSVIIFDPTAQWTGFLRKGTDKRMLKRFKYFDMKTKEVRAFNGSIKTIHDPYEVIDIKKYINRPGEITIFNVSHLKPKEIDVVVASTVEQIFDSAPEESKNLKTLIVYDEVHRLLPKFGGSGQGFVQLERGAREFRKWGIGLVLISQVLSDFVGEIKANIGTEIQMGTRYEGDLERVSTKYGEDILKSVVKEPIGTGMVVNAEYNSGRPYFIAFRPLLHSTKRLSNDELKQYEKYFDEIEDIEYQIHMLKKKEVDILDLELELKLARGKVKEGQFQMSEMYLEGLRPKIEEQWSSLGIKPMHLVRKKLKRQDVEQGIEKAKKERAKYIKKNPEKVLSFGEEVTKIKGKLDELKKEGKDTTKVEQKLADLENRIKPLKGKVKGGEADGIRKEFDELKKNIGEIK